MRIRHINRGRVKEGGCSFCKPSIKRSESDRKGAIYTVKHELEELDDPGFTPKQLQKKFW